MAYLLFPAEAGISFEHSGKGAVAEHHMGSARAVVVAFAIRLGRIARDHRQRGDLGDAVLPANYGIDVELDMAHDAVRLLATRIEKLGRSRGGESGGQIG